MCRDISITESTSTVETNKTKYKNVILSRVYINETFNLLDKLGPSHMQKHDLSRLLRKLFTNPFHLHFIRYEWACAQYIDFSDSSATNAKGYIVRRFNSSIQKCSLHRKLVDHFLNDNVFLSFQVYVFFPLTLTRLLPDLTTSNTTSVLHGLKIV